MKNKYCELVFFCYINQKLKVIMLNVEKLGQVFTTKEIVNKMLGLRQNNGNVLEPSCGDGAFFNSIENCVGIEFDSLVCPENALNIDFFDYSLNNKFDTIIGNPPYVKYKKIQETTKKKLNMEVFNERSNLYLFFIEKCIAHLEKNGELILIVPRDFIKASSAINLNKLIYESGTITHWIDFGDEIVFPGFAPNCAIFRFQKNDFSRKTFKDNKFVDFKLMNGQLLFSENEYPMKLSDLFMVKVGAVSGGDKYFIHEQGNKEFVCSETRETGTTRKMFYNVLVPHLEKHKNILINRKVRKFNENSWYKWGRSYYETELPRIYVNSKTRKKDPFFLHNCLAYDGSILALFPKMKLTEKSLTQLVDDMNQVNWQELGFICGGRYLFTQRSLEESFLPIIFKKYLT